MNTPTDEIPDGKELQETPAISDPQNLPNDKIEDESDSSNIKKDDISEKLYSPQLIAPDEGINRELNLQEYQNSLNNAQKNTQEHEFNLGQDTIEVGAGFSYTMFFVSQGSLSSLDKRFGKSVFSKESLVETSLDELRRKRVLFIQAPTEDWLEISVANLKILKREIWPEAADIRRVVTKREHETTFGFWADLVPVNRPTILVINDSKYDYIRQFMQAGLGTISEHKKKLEASNIYLVCQLIDTVDGRYAINTFSTALQREQFGWWEPPVVQEEIIKIFGEEDGLELFATIKDLGLMNFGQTEIYLTIQDICTPPEGDPSDLDWKMPNKDNFVEKLKGGIQKRQDDLKPELRDLKEILNSGDQIQRLLVFCGAFFPKITVTDFKKLVVDLLSNDLEKPNQSKANTLLDIELLKETDPEIRRYLIDQHSTLNTPKLLRDILEDEIEERFEKCKLKIVKEGRNRKVQFYLPKLTPVLREYILENKYLYFQKIYDRFRETGLLYEEAINENKLNALVRFIVTAAQNDADEHDAEWLTKLVADIKNQLTIKVPDKLDLISFLQYIEHDVRLRGVMNMLLGRLTELVKEILLTQDEEMREMAKKFFRLLLDQKDVREIALRMALVLFRKLKEVPGFDEDLVLSYFKRVFDEGAVDQKLSAYNLLKNNFPPSLLFKITQTWINDQSIKNDSGTKKIARYYCLEYCLYSFSDCFRETEKNNDSEHASGRLRFGLDFFKEIDDSIFYGEFQPFIQCLTNDNCIEAWNQVSDAFQSSSTIAHYLEYLVTKERPSENRMKFSEPVAISFLGDVLENWFYILVRVWFTARQMKLETPFVLTDIPPIQYRWEKYVKLICDGFIPVDILDEANGMTNWLSREEGNNLTELLKYLDNKLEYHAEISLRLNDLPKIDKTIIEKIETIRTRHICAELFVRLIRDEIASRIK